MKVPMLRVGDGPLLRNLIRREVRQRYKGSILGLAWTLVNPAIVVVAYWLVFKFLFGSPIQNFALFMFVGLSIWTLVFGGFQVAAPSLVSNAALVTKVRFTREIVPIAAMAANAVLVIAMLAIAVPLSIILGTGSVLPLALFPVILVLAAVMTMGVGLILSAVNVYFRDVQHVLDAIAIPWFFLTPIFYTYASLPDAAQSHQWLVDILHFGNPISPFVIATQDVVFFGTWPAPVDMAYCVVAALVFWVAGQAIFRRLEREMAVEL